MNCLVCRTYAYLWHNHAAYHWCLALAACHLHQLADVIDGLRAARGCVPNCHATILHTTCCFFKLDKYSSICQERCHATRSQEQLAHLAPPTLPPRHRTGTHTHEECR